MLIGRYGKNRFWKWLHLENPFVLRGSWYYCFSMYMSDVMNKYCCHRLQGVVCFGHKSINLSKYKSQMYLLDGSIVGKSLIITNSGKSCIELSVKLIKIAGRSIGHSLIGWNVYYKNISICMFINIHKTTEHIMIKRTYTIHIISITW